MAKEAALAYRPDVDGLRAIAIIAVVLYHANPAWLPAGYLGVDVFFVISGFLIGSLLLADIAQGSFRYRSFLLRRMRRLYPALITMLGVCAIPGVYLLVPEDAEDFGESLAAAAAFVSNFLFFTEDGYFEPAVELVPLLHTWSLGVEEQFYLVFPWLLLLTVRWWRTHLNLMLVLVGMLSLGLWWWQSTHHSQAAFYLLPARMWELLTGALIALHGRDQAAILPRMMTGLAARRPVASNVFGVAGLALLIGALSGLLGVNSRWAVVGCCLGTAMLIVSGLLTQSLTRTLLSTRPLIGVGLISYSLYLWHWPALVFARHYLVRSLSSAEATAVVALALVLAYLSWRFVEQPFRGARGELTDRTLLRAAWATGGLVVMCGLLLDQTEGWPERYDRAQLAPLTEYAVSERRECVGLAPAKISSSNLCRLGAADVRPTAAIWGDSHAAGFVPLVDELAAARQINVVSATAYGCAPLLGVGRVIQDPKRPCREFNERVFSVLAADAQIEHVILAARWAAHASGSGFGMEGSAVTYLTDGIRAAASRTENIRLFKRGLDAAVHSLLNVGKHVYVLDSVPEIGRPIPKLMLLQQLHERVESLALAEDEFRHRQRDVVPILRALSNLPQVHVFDIARFLCHSGACAAVTADKPLYSDSNHLSIHGLAQVRPVFVTLFDQLTMLKPATAQVAQE